MIAEADDEDSYPRRAGKSENAFRTISEVSEDLDVPQHVLRFWESKFTQIRPLKRGGGRRYYRPEDLTLLRRIRDLLYREGYTIRGVQKLLRDSPNGIDDGVTDPPHGAPEAPSADTAADPRPVTDDLSDHETLIGILDELILLRTLLAKAREE